MPIRGSSAKLFSFGKSDAAAATPRALSHRRSRARATSTNVTVQNSQGAPEASEVGRRIASLLVDDLK